MGRDGRPAYADADAEFRRLGAELARQLCQSIPGWVEREVGRVLGGWEGPERPSGDAPGGPDGLSEDGDRRRAVLAAAALAGHQAAETARPVLESLLAMDVDGQRATPLQVVRGLVRFPTAVLEAAGVPALRRDRFAEERFPDDPYGLTPASLGAVDPALTEPSLVWGAAKALAHRRRHRPPTNY